MSKQEKKRVKKLAKKYRAQLKAASEAEKKAMLLVERASIAEWKESLKDLDAEEQRRQRRAFAVYRLYRYLPFIFG